MKEGEKLLEAKERYKRMRRFLKSSQELEEEVRATEPGGLKFYKQRFGKVGK